MAAFGAKVHFGIIAVDGLAVSEDGGGKFERRTGGDRLACRDSDVRFECKFSLARGHLDAWGQMNKTERLLKALEASEGEYRSMLNEALAKCAEGRWGLFGQNEHLYFRGFPAELVALRELATDIDHMRDRFGEGPFELHQELEAARGQVDANAPGEPKLATIWLEKLSRR